MDLKNKIKQTGIRLAKQELNKSKIKQVRKIDNSLIKNAVQQSTNRRSKGRLVENLLESSAEDMAKSMYTKPLAKGGYKINSSTVGSILNNVVDVPGIVQDKLDSQVNKVIKNFKTPSTKSEIEKHKKDIANIISNSDIGKKSISIKSLLESKKSNSMSDLLKRAVNDKLSESTKGILDVNRKSPTPTTPTSIIGGGADIPPTQNLKSNPWTVKQHDNFKNTPITIDTTNNPDEPKLIFTVIDPKSPSTTDQVKQDKNNEKGNTVNHSFKFPIQKNTLIESHSFSYDTAEKTFMSKELDENVTDTLGGILKKAANSVTKGNFQNSEDKLLQISRKAINPNIEQIFKNVDIRNFSFQFLLIPKNEKEYKNYLKAIHMFKYWSHPDKTVNTTSKILNYPAYWKIDLHLGDKHLHPHIYTKNAYCTDIQVEWSGGAELVLNNTNNAFTAIGLKMDFVELDILTRENIDPSGAFIK